MNNNSCFVFPQAMTQERRRYGFVLERLSSLAKHYLAYHSAGNTLYEKNIDEWIEVTKTREMLPDSVEAICAKRLWVSVVPLALMDGVICTHHIAAPAFYSFGGILNK